MKKSLHTYQHTSYRWSVSAGQQVLAQFTNNKFYSMDISAQQRLHPHVVSAPQCAFTLAYYTLHIKMLLIF